jgi:hypothetical protein
MAVCLNSKTEEQHSSDGKRKKFNRFLILAGSADDTRPICINRQQRLYCCNY